MADYIGGPGDDIFSLTYRSTNNDADVFGGGGYDRLTIDTSGAFGTQIDTIEIRPHEVDVSSWYWSIRAGRPDTQVVTYEDIEQVTVVTNGLRLLFWSLPATEMILDGAGGAMRIEPQWGIDIFDGVRLSIADPDTPYRLAGTSVSLMNFDRLSLSFLPANIGDHWIEGGSQNDYVFGGWGRDMLFGGGGHDELSGSEGDDQIFGDDGDDKLDGGGGNDVVEGGGGSDVMNGGLGRDTLSYEHALAGVRVTLETKLYQDTGGAGFDQVSGFENIRGSAFNDDLTGDNGNNILSGLAGADRMVGQGGDDQYWVDTIGDVVIEATGGGYDAVFSRIDYSLPDNVEALTLIGRANVDAIGNDLDNVLTGNAGNNRLQGLSGEDVLIGGAGDDIYHVNSAGDVVIEAPGEGNDLIVSSRSIDLLSMADVENVRLVGGRSLNLNGNALDNVLQGNAGDNILRGFGGHDVLTGGAGRDIFGFDRTPGMGNLVTITDFVVGEDRIDLVGTAFAALAPGALSEGSFASGGMASDADDRILYDGATGGLFYDADGSGVGEAVQFATLSPGLTLANTDFWVV
ncbi:calcium-binding protein [Sphingobium yanoikuyae]|uniref:calcium-binding protein n=1 Tax=Sphingobium yanoikuyae TaxID=13690 RepID=UPI002FDA6FC3